jgi:prepilin-type processing-associated H-X9-DG protein
MLKSHPAGLRARAWRLAGLGVLALGVAALVLWYGDASTAGDKDIDKDSVSVPADLAWVPADAALFATLRPAKLWDCPEGKILREQLPLLAEDLERELERSTGLKPKEIERLTWVMPQWEFSNRQRSEAGIGAPDSKSEPPPSKEQNPPKEKEPVPEAAVAAGPPQPQDYYEPRELLIATAVDPAALARVLKDVKSNGQAHQHQGKTFYTVQKEKHGERVAWYFVNDRTVVRSGTKLIQKGLERTSTETKGPLAPALRLAKEKHHLAVGAQITEKEARALLEDLGRSEFRGLKRALKPLIHARAAAGFANLGKQTQAELHVYFRNGAQAKLGLPAAEDALALLRIHGLNQAMDGIEEEMDNADDPRREQEAMFGIQILEQLESGLRGVKSSTNAGQLLLQAQASTDLASLAAKTKDLLKARAADEAAIAAKNNRKSQNNLKQIAVALHSIHDAYKSFPPATLCDKQGKPCLSWRVAILPYIEQGPLYQQFKLDEPWDSPNNIKLLAQMPKVFAAPGIKTKEPGLTYYQGFVADPKLGPEHQTAWETNVAPNTQFGAKGTRMVSFTDGTSNTILLVEAAEAVPWTKPVNLRYDPKQPLPKLGPYKDGFNALFADGHVTFIGRDINVATLRLLITRADGQPVPYFGNTP